MILAVEICQVEDSKGIIGVTVIRGLVALLVDGSEFN